MPKQKQDDRVVTLPLVLVMRAAKYIQDTPTAPGVPVGIPMSLMVELEDACNESLEEQKRRGSDKPETPKEKALREKSEAAAKEAQESLDAERAGGRLLLRKTEPAKNGDGEE